MSLMNKMLRDLDERRASELEKDGISRHVRTLPPSKAVPWKGPALTIVGAIAGAVVVWLGLTWRQDTSSLSPRVTTGSDAMVVVPPAQSQPIYPAVERFHPPSKPESNQVRKETQRPDTHGTNGHEPSLRLDRSLEISGARYRQPAPQIPIVDSQASETPALPARIEKQSRTPLASEASDAEYRKGMSAIKRGSVGEASTALRSALRIEPGHMAARQALLSILVDQKQWNEAQAVGTEGLALDPKQAGWAMFVARLQVERGDMPAAIKTLDEHAQYAESNADYLGFHALLLQKAKRLPEAVQRYRSALALKPGEGRWWYGLGLALDASQRPTEAKEAYAQAQASANLPADLAAAVDQKLKNQ